MCVPEDGLDEAMQHAFNRIVRAPRGTIEQVADIINLLAARLDGLAQAKAGRERAARSLPGSAVAAIKAEPESVGQCADTDGDEDVGINLTAAALAVSVIGQGGTGTPGGETVVDVMIPHDRLEEFHHGVAQYALSRAADAMRTTQAELEAAIANGAGR